MATAGLQDSDLTHRDLLSMLTRITGTTPEVAMRDHEAILKMTEDVFPEGVVSVEETVDPEIENYEHIAIVVVTPGEVDDLVAGDRKWHQRLRSAAPATARYYVLSMSVA